MLTLFALLGLAAIIGFWYDALRAKERARAVCLRACQQQGLQLLDDTVTLDKLWVRRGAEGWLLFERRYLFEFTDTGAQRHEGLVVMLGTQVQVLALSGGDLFIG
jgi:hypothetical protein